MSFRPVSVRPLAPLAFLFATLLTCTVCADTLLIERVQRGSSVAKPVNGTPMGAVRARLGEPLSQVGPVAGNKPQHPRITGWVYPDFTVYFERDIVLYSVLNQSKPEEIGPAPLRR